MSILVALLGCLVLVVGLLVTFLYLLVGAIYNSVEPTPPTEEMIEAGFDKCVLFKYIPALKGKIAWLSLGNYPTPVCTMTFTNPATEEKATVMLKREDMSSDMYGGNKVRTLEFHLGSAKAMQLRREGSSLFSIGGPGSNQIVATDVYGSKNEVKITSYPFGAEGASLDNSLNLLSMLSFGKVKPLWVSFPLKTLLEMAKILLFSNNIMSPPGGNNKTGTLGHVAALFELLDQVKSEVKMPRDIFLALGSSCTTSGLLSGICLALKMGFTDSAELKKLRIHPVIIHHGFATVPFAVKWAIRKVVTDTLTLIADLGGPDALDQVDSVIAENLVIHADYAGLYGCWTDKGLMAKVVGASSTISGSYPRPWLCSCFTSKAFACLMDTLVKTGRVEDSERVMFWCTKSLVQPKGSKKDGWEEVQKEFPEKARKWLQEGFIRNEADFEEAMRTRLAAAMG